jgi:hypothetical protein
MGAAAANKSSSLVEGAAKLVTFSSLRHGCGAERSTFNAQLGGGWAFLVELYAILEGGVFALVEV